MTTGTLNINFIIRQISRSRRQAFVFVLCVALSIVTLISLNGFSASVNSSMLNDARTLHAADIIIRSYFDLSASVMRLVEKFEAQNTIRSSRVWEFYSVVRSQKNKNSLLAKLKIVQPGYPFYGQVALKSGRDFEDVLTPGGIIVAQSLLDRLHLQVGDALHIGSATLRIKDVVLQEPDQPVNLFLLGPRIFIAAADLEALDLVKKGSRVEYRCLIKVLDGNQCPAGLQIGLKAAADPDQERVETYRTAGSRIKRFFDNLFFFLSLISIFTLLLAGIGIQSALTAFLKEKEKTIAVMKTVGASSGFHHPPLYFYPLDPGTGGNACRTCLRPFSPVRVGSSFQRPFARQYIPEYFLAGARRRALPGGFGRRSVFFYPPASVKRHQADHHFPQGAHSHQNRAAHLSEHVFNNRLFSVAGILAGQ